eukprot:6006891-Amphidinium_carterae.1
MSNDNALQNAQASGTILGQPWPCCATLLRPRAAHARSRLGRPTWADANHAGCMRTRKTVSGFCATAGLRTLLTQVNGQGVIALSSAEAE